MKTLAERNEELRAMAERMIAENQARYINSDSYITDYMLKADNDKLDAILHDIEERYSNNKRKAQKTFRYGVINNKIISIVKNIQYASQIDKVELISWTNISENQIEEFLNAFGNTAYFSTKRLEIVEEVPMDVKTVKEMISKFYTILGLTTKPSFIEFTEASLKAKSEVALANAVELQRNTMELLEINNEVTYEE